LIKKINNYSKIDNSIINNKNKNQQDEFNIADESLNALFDSSNDKKQKTSTTFNYLEQDDDNDDYSNQGINSDSKYMNNFDDMSDVNLKSNIDNDLDNIMGEESFDFRNAMSHKAKMKEWNALKEKIKNDEMNNTNAHDIINQVNNAKKTDQFGGNMELSLNSDGTVKLDERINKMIDDEFEKLANSDFLNELKELEKNKNNMLAQKGKLNQNDSLNETSNNFSGSNLPDLDLATLTPITNAEFEYK